MENEEIDLIEVMAKLWHRKKTIMYIALFFLVGGLVLAFFLPRKYTAQCTLGLEMEDRGIFLPPDISICLPQRHPYKRRLKSPPPHQQCLQDSPPEEPRISYFHCFI